MIVQDMKLDPNKRYLLSRPMGGFNDTLVQIEVCRLYAAKYDRLLVIDTSRAGLREQLDRLFTVSDDFGCEVLFWNEDMAAAFDAARSVRPALLRYRISKYRTRYFPEGRLHGDRATGYLIGFDFFKDHDEQVLVYQHSGGGYASIHLLGRLVLRPEIANTIAKQLRRLGSDYDAVHVRHSDYRTDFNTFLTRLRPVLRGRRVLICSDSADAKASAKTILDQSSAVMSVSDIPDMGGRPLHRAAGIDLHKANVDLLTDLMAMALASALFFTHLAGKHSRDLRCSGFSLLADLLRRHPETIDHLFSNADPSLVEPVLAPRSATLSPEQSEHRLAFDRWNHHARAKSLKRYDAASAPVVDRELFPKRGSGHSNRSPGRSLAMKTRHELGVLRIKLMQLIKPYLQACR